MADLDSPARLADADLAALYWWRRDLMARNKTDEPAPPTERLDSLVEQAVPITPDIAALPGNHLRASAAVRCAREVQTLRQDNAPDPDLPAGLHHEGRSARLDLTTALIAIAAASVAMIYVATMQDPVALGFAIAGTFAASFALYHAARRYCQCVPTRSIVMARNGCGPLPEKARGSAGECSSVFPR